MRILFISRATLYETVGGDTIQIQKTAEYLRKLGIDVNIRLTNETNIDYKNYDLLHVFNIIRPADLLKHVINSKLPLVISPIYVEYSNDTNQAYSGALQWIMKCLNAHGREYIKTLGRAILKAERIQSWRYLAWGQRRSISYLLKKCAYLLPNSQSEYLRLQRDFKHTGTHAVVPNAVDTQMFPYKENKAQKNTVLCVARFEPRKNQLKVIEALNNTGFQVTFVGAPAPNHIAYYQKCKTIAADNIRFVDFVPQKALTDLYHRHKVHILASWFETTGLSSLEAAACGCNVVVAPNGDTKDYFENFAFYCSPDSTDSIFEAVQKASETPSNAAFHKQITNCYNWNETANKTLLVYKKLLNKEPIH